VTWLGERITADLRNAVYGHVIAQSPEFFETTQTGEVLSRLMAKRYELATTLGYANWADYTTENKMIGTGRAADEFIDRAGFTKKDALIDWLYETATMPAGEYWDTQLIQNYIYPRATFGEEPWASKLKAAPDELIPIFRREDIHVVVVGGETNGYWRIMGCNYQKSVSVDEWR